MSYYKFGPNDIFNNVIKTYPQCKFLIHNGKAFYNKKPSSEGSFSDYEENRKKRLGDVSPKRIKYRKLKRN